jgi:hypothetical protein
MPVGGTEPEQRQGFDGVDACEEPPNRVAWLADRAEKKDDCAKGAETDSHEPDNSSGPEGSSDDEANISRITVGVGAKPPFQFIGSGKVSEKDREDKGTEDDPEERPSQPVHIFHDAI